MGWRSLQPLPNKAFKCGHCGERVSSDRGYRVGRNPDGSGPHIGGSYICPNCVGPTLIMPGVQFPGPPMGNAVARVPADLDQLYKEARDCARAGCYTASVLLCRKMLMNLAVAQGAAEGSTFLRYVEYLADQGYLPPNGRHWVDHIRLKGNEATHEIAVMNETDAEELITFTEMLLRFIYEFPSMITPPTTGP